MAPVNDEISNKSIQIEQQWTTKYIQTIKTISWNIQEVPVQSSSRHTATVSSILIDIYDVDELRGSWSNERQLNRKTASQNVTTQ